MKTAVTLATLFLLLMATVTAQEGHVRLLAVSEGPSGLQGSVADLFLRMERGDGRVFIESRPLTKVDTQISTRFAKQVVCELFAKNCNQYDFFYTIEAKAPIVGGPSAGAAAALLTLSVLEGLPTNEEVSITGTINSGGLIGPVGGIIQKTEAGAEEGISTVLIPHGERFSDENGTIVDAVKLGKEHNITVVEVSDLYEASAIMLGRAYERPTREPVIDRTYAQTMIALADDICARSEAHAGTRNSTTAQQLQERATAAEKTGEQYSRASFCFGANIQYAYEKLLGENLTAVALASRINTTKEDVEAFNKSLPAYRTVTDLQSYSVVMERLSDARERLERSRDLLAERQNEQAAFELAYAAERLVSARAWASFLGKGTTTKEFSADALRVSCITKLAEAEERIQYVTLLFPGQQLEGMMQEVTHAQQQANEGEYALCLFKASKAKAEADTVLSVAGIQQEHLNETLSRKLQVTKESILRQNEKGLFPIVGYSYYEYAQSLRGSDIFSALLFAEYALELSNLDVYFDQPKRTKQQKAIMKRNILPQLVFLAAGILIGASAAYGLSRKPAGRRKIIIQSSKKQQKNPGRAPKRPAGEKR